MRMHENNPQEAATSMIPKLKIRNWNGKEADCPSIKKQIEEFQHLQSSPPKLTTGVIVLHPMNHEFHIQSPEGDMNFVIWNDESPLVKWALETRRALESCAKTR